MTESERIRRIKELIKTIYHYCYERNGSHRIFHMIDLVKWEDFPYSTSTISRFTMPYLIKAGVIDIFDDSSYKNRYIINFEKSELEEVLGRVEGMVNNR